MKLYRAHTPEFHQMIQNGEFVADNSRKFNQTDGVKNAGELYFYSPSVECAKKYKSYGCEVYEFEADEVNLLDLRVKENRSLLIETIQMFIDEDEVKRQDMIKHIPAKFQSERMQRPTTVEDVINDDVLDSITYWGQRCSDFQFGKVMRKQLESLGFDGIIFEQANNTDIALLNPAKISK